jgi:iturin family lipopeptide synthetase A/iturin family lipopeptide synthetase C/tyrocidine synthetase-3
MEIYNEYGPTEATVGCMIHRYDREKDLALSVPIGIPAANTCIFILDEHLSPVPIGDIGEMYIAGDGLARGYFNRTELTAEKFLKATDPRQNGPVAKLSVVKPGPLRLYKTGDIARWNANGSMEFLGRADNQVKIGGARIELGEIEARLLKHSDVRECVVDVVGWDGKQMVEQNADAKPSKTSETSINRLVAYYVSGKSLNAAELRVHLAQELPAYMLPQHFIRLDKMPLTSNGKIDRKALPAPTSDNLAISHDFVRPHTETEKALAVIWTELLKVDSIGINDSFFDLGGHSLLAIKAVSRIRDVFEVDLPIHTLFHNPTIADLAKVLAEVRRSNKNIQPPNDLRLESESADLAARKEIERTIATIWENMLQLEDINVNDDFFELGGSLLSSANLIAKINYTFTIKLPLSVIFQKRTVSKLASLVEIYKAKNA